MPVLDDLRAVLDRPDHVHPYGDGGDTVTGNGQPACGFHNRWKHQQHHKKSNGQRERKPGPRPRNRPRSRTGDDDSSADSRS